jgi:hypothetical protein
MSDVTPLMRRVLGSETTERLEELLPLISSGSLTAFETVCELADEFGMVNPRIYVTDNDNVQIEWEDTCYHHNEIECFPDRFEYFFEGPVVDGSVSLKLIKDAVADLKR